MSGTGWVKCMAMGCVLGLLAACGTPNEAVNLSDNTRGYRITCGGAYSSVSDCYEKAGYICGSKGYTTIHETDIAPPPDANYFWNAAAHELIMRCNTPANAPLMNAPLMNPPAMNAPASFNAAH